MNLKACLTDKLLLVHKSFTNKPLILGNIFLYYCQYLSQCVFNNPFTIEPFTQNQEIKNKFPIIVYFFKSKQKKQTKTKVLNLSRYDKFKLLVFSKVEKVLPRCLMKLIGSKK